MRWRRTHAVAALGLVGLMVAAGCGGDRQDENEPTGDFEVEVVRAEFPEKQQLAKSSAMVITVRNAGDETIPNVGITVKGFNFRKDDDPALADPSRPVFVPDGDPVQIGGLPESKDATPRGCDTAYVDTWACGPLRAGRETTFRWRVTAVKAGDYDLRWRVSAGLYGKAAAVAVGSDAAPSGSFTGTISAVPVKSRVADDDVTVITED